MPHVDDGTLHALLDGALGAADPPRAEAVEAHLEGCADCRARLDAAGALRERASGILAALEPEAVRGAAPVLAPDFDEVRRRAAARGAAAEDAPPAGARRRDRRWAPVLAWAASLVVALGIGYLIRDQVVPAAGRPEAALQALPPAAEREVATSTPAADAEEAAGERQALDAAGSGAAGAPGSDLAEREETAASTDAESPASGGLAGGDPSEARRAAPGTAEQPRARQLLVTTGAETAPAAGARREVRQGAGTERGPAGPAAGAGREAPQEAGTEADSAAPLELAESAAPARPRQQTAGTALASGLEDRVDAPPAPSPAARPQSSTVERSGREKAAATARNAASPPPAPPVPSAVDETVQETIQREPLVVVAPSTGQPVVVTGREAPPEGWRTVTADQARRLLQGPLYALPGARVTSLLAERSSDPVRVRTRQRLPDGEIVEVTQRLLAGERSAEEIAVLPRRRSEGRAQRPEAETAPAPPPTAADESRTPSATVRLDGFEITVAGDLPPEALRALARTAVPFAATPVEADRP